MGAKRRVRDLKKKLVTIAVVTAVRDAIRDESRKRKVTFVDPYGWDFELLPDGLHPTVKGHEQIAARLYEEVGPLLG